MSAAVVRRKLAPAFPDTAPKNFSRSDCMNESDHSAAEGNGSDVPDGINSHSRESFLEEPKMAFGLVSSPLHRALSQRFGNSLATSLIACSSASHLRGPLRSLGLCQNETLEEDILGNYFDNPVARNFSPNPLFDELWYRGFNPDIAEAVNLGTEISGFVHFVNSGCREGRWPNAFLATMAESVAQVGPELNEIDKNYYVEHNLHAKRFLENFPILTPLDHYNLYGRRLGFSPEISPSKRLMESRNSVYHVLAAEFDEEYYRAKYIGAGAPRKYIENPFLHYVAYGLRAASSPNEWFHEAWYRVFYPDVRESVRRGDLPCGFYHFLVAGRAEGRIPRFDRKRALEARIPGVTVPALLHRISLIEARQCSVPIELFDRAVPTVWFLMPTLNPDITFGGYRAAFEMICAMKKNGYRVAIVCTEDGRADADYFMFREPSESLKQLISTTLVLNHATLQKLEVGTKDKVVAYSAWDLAFAHRLAQHTEQPRPYLLAQEYEPVFYDNCSGRAILEQAYQIPHYPIINSEFLKRYFQSRQIGVFSARSSPKLWRDYAVFEHRINLLPAQTAASMARRSRRVLAAYARPEGHAARNLFEVLVLALRQVSAEGLFGAEWSFIGIGALTDLDPVPLGPQHRLTLVARMTEEEYRCYLGSLDIGVSLMYAPHPSVVPFEFATTGAVVVTNTYENRSADELRRICSNFVPCSPDVAGVARGLREAIVSAQDFEARERQIYRPRNTAWDNIFHQLFLFRIFGRPPAKAPAMEEQIVPIGTPRDSYLDGLADAAQLGS